MPGNIPHIDIKDYDYPLPDERIAQYPLEERDASKLLIYRHGEIAESTFNHLADYIPAKNVLIFNDTKVIHARLLFEHENYLLELFCLEPLSPEVLPEKALNVKNKSTWACMIGNARRWKQGSLTKNIVIDNNTYSLVATRGQGAENAYHITFEWTGNLTFGDVIEAAGAMPLPPYIKRAPDAEDESRYQTIYSRHAGSVAAPTAGLHFTDDLFNKLEIKGIDKAEVTLHVGAGTFRPIKEDDILTHSMHQEIITVDIRSLSLLRDRIADCIAVGTTSMRTIESVYWCGVRLMNGEADPFFVPQWYPYECKSDIPYKDALDAVISYLTGNNDKILVAKTALLCMPGYKFHGMRGLVTNFHQPRSTLLLLISAFVGNDWKKIYKYALDNEFRFLSYGDASLLLKS